MLSYVALIGREEAAEATVNPSATGTMECGREPSLAAGRRHGHARIVHLADQAPGQTPVPAFEWQVSRDGACASAPYAFRVLRMCAARTVAQQNGKLGVD